MARHLWKTGTGNYPNNVINYLLNTSPLYHVYIPEDGRELRLLWQSVTKTLPPYYREAIELVFDEQFTLKTTARAIGVSATTARNVVRRLHTWLNKDGFAMQPLYNYASLKGYVYFVTEDDMRKAWKEFMNHEEISELEAIQFYHYLEKGLLIHECGKLLAKRTALLMRLYNKAIEMCKQRKED